MNLLFQNSPLPITLLLLWATLPGIWWGAGAFCEMLPADLAVRRVLRPAVALAGWIVGVELASLAVHSFWLGMPLGMIVLSAMGLALWWFRRGTTPEIAAGAEADSRLSRGMWLGMFLATAPIVAMAWSGPSQDDMLPTGHMSTTAQLQNDYFPPHLLGFPHVLLRYHYGFDLVCAGLTGLTRCRVDTAIRAATVFGWAYCWCLLWVLGERLTGTKQGGLWTALATLLGGGAMALFIPFLGSTDWLDRFDGRFTFGTGRAINVPLVSYIFQHPFSLGFPLGVAVLLLALEPPPQRSAAQDWTRQALLGLLLAALSLTQVVLFVTLSATLTFTEVVLARRWRFLLALTGAWAAAWLMGGMLFTRVSGNSSFGLSLQFWPTAAAAWANEPLWRRALRIAVWHVATFGALLPLGVWGLWHVRRLRTALLLLAAGGLAVPLLFTYRYTLDIVKFSTIAAWALGILSGGALTWLAARRTAASRLALAGCVIALTASPVVFIIGTVLRIQFAPRAQSPWFFSGEVTLGPDDRQAVDWLRTRVRPDELVYRTSNVSLGYIQAGGLPLPYAEFVEAKARLWGVDPQRASLVSSLLATRHADLGGYRSLGIDWFVVGPDDPQMERNVRQWTQSGELVEKAEFGELRIYNLADPTAPRDLSPPATSSSSSAP